MINLLLLSCGTNACVHVSKVLKSLFPNDFYIVGCDVNKEWLIPSSLYLDDFVQCPYSSEKDYYQFILDVCIKKRIEWLLPSFDTDQFLLSCDNPDLKKLGVKSFGISNNLNFYKDKIKTNLYLKSIGIPIPKVFDIKDIDNDTEYFVKPINGVGSSGASKKNGAEIKEKIAGTSYLIQEICFNPEYTLECFCYNKKLYSVCRERIASKSGVCTKARVFKNKILENYAKKLVEHIQVPYIFNMQFMKNSLNEYVCTDLNLRTAGGMSLSFAAGWDEVSAIARVMLNKSESEIISTVDNDIQEQYVVRRYEDIVTKKINCRIAFDFDGTILDSRMRHNIVMADVLRRYGIKIDASTLVLFKSNGKTNLDWLKENGLSENIAQQVNSEWISVIEDEKYLKIDTLYPDVIDILKNLSKENDLYLITARNNKDACLNQIKTLGIGQFFNEVVIVPTCSETSLLKAEELKNRNIKYFIGDTESDCKAADIAKCKFYAVSYGFRSTKFLKKYTANVIDGILESLFSY